ncbi:family 20 glycosylhydrolase [Pedobacter sp. GR22-6]|uniref:family 20 glycosylhydrolase n=1 Tax=Pedobacter sp. GR22-6 TaxID=3127957 RepID=UPI00307FCF45
MKLNLFSIALLLFACSCFAQKNKSPFAGKLTLTWKVLQQNFNADGETLSELVLSNSGSATLPEKGWSIYFNGPDPIVLDTSSAAIGIKHINGDFFKMFPHSRFKRMGSNQESKFKIRSRAIKNKTDYGLGFYLILDSQPDSPIDLVLKIDPLSPIDKEKQLSNALYKQNEAVARMAPGQVPAILPSPLKSKAGKGTFSITASVGISADPAFSREAVYLSNELDKVLDKKPLVGGQKQKNMIALQHMELKGNEAYQLQITNDLITISAPDPAGAFYGIQSLKMLFPAIAWKSKQAQITVPAMEVHDAPRFGHRAFMMDIARNFQPKQEILKTLDVLSLYKINVFHLHFNDDEGWRIEIKGLPELTEIGAKRAHTIKEETALIPSYGSGPLANRNSGSGYLSRTDFIEILKYATERHIQVIPEYETPGHARAAIKSMDARYARLMKARKPEEAKAYLLRDLNDQSIYRSVQGFNDNVINPALPSTYRFVEKIIDETISMYRDAGATLKTIHFGGDEVPAGVWEKSPVVVQLLKENSNITSVDDLWYHYFQKVNGMLKSRNLYLSGWEEIGLRKVRTGNSSKMVLDQRAVPQNFHTDVWNNLSGNEDLAYQLANAGYKVVLTNVTNMYLDLAYNKSYFEPGQYWGGYVDVDKPFSFIPFDYYKNQKEDSQGDPLPENHYDGKEKLSDAGRANIIGLQAPLWSEIITGTEQFEYLLLPKVLGLAERSWAADPDWAKEQDSAKSKQLYEKAWSDFVYQIGRNELPRLNYYAGGFKYRIPAAGYVVDQNLVKVNLLYPGFSIRYTTDGTEPDTKSPLYHQPIPYNKTLKLKVFTDTQRGGRSIDVYK